MLGRYFYFESNGSNSNGGNHLVEVQIVDTDGVNRALGRGLLRYSNYNSYGASPSIVTDGNTSYSSYFDFGEGRQHVVIDLGDVYDISYIKVWRYYSGGRTYKDVHIRVSIDDVYYTTVFSSAFDGEYAETAEGKQIDILNLEHDVYEKSEDPSAPIFDMPLKDSIDYTGDPCIISVSGSNAITFTEDAFSATTYNGIIIDFPNALDPCTISLMFKMYSNGTSQYPYYRRLIWGFNSSDSKVFSLEVGYSSGATTNKLVFGKSFTDELNDDNWHTCVLKKNGQTITCTIDDVYTDTISTSVELQKIALSASSYALNGLIKDVKVYDRIVDDFSDPDEPETPEVPEVPEVPEEPNTLVPPSLYTKLSYIQSDGNQYINTIYNPKSSTKLEISFKMLEKGAFMYGVSDGTNRYSSSLATGNRFSISYGSNISATGSINQGGVNVDTLIEHSNNMTITDDYYTDTSISFKNTGEWTIGYPLFIFANNYKGEVEAKSKMRLYYFKIYDGNVLVHWFKPVTRKSDGEIGLYDTVDGVFYTNQGTGTFTAGAVLPDDEWIEPEQTTGKVRINGRIASITGGIILLNGVIRQITEGTTLIDGTVKRISFELND